MDEYLDIVAFDMGEDPIRRVVRIVQANLPGSQRDLDSRAAIGRSSQLYLAAVTELVLEGRLNIDDGRDLVRIVEGIVRE
jgi:hypothetical protein